jgi:predicted alpha/beta hydrolase family esterase
MMVAHWAQRFRRRVEGALLAAPPDFESPLPEGYPVQSAGANGWTPMPRAPLPFRASSRRAPTIRWARLDRVVALARQWGASS